jgi:flavin-dependent dehydrogenase
VRADVLVVGAGPAGSAAAAVLAAGGARVVLADAAVFPRDKVCGDGLLPDAVAALAELGAEREVRRAGHPIAALRLRDAGAGAVRVPADGAVVRRAVLDALLAGRAAVAGAELLTGATLVGFERSGGRFVGARLRTAAGETTVAARAFVLATGAARGPRELAGLGGGGRPAVAVRGYARLSGLPRDELLLDLRADLTGGYAWAFCTGGDEWNVGCGLPHDSRHAGSLVQAGGRFLRELGGAAWSSPPRGAPLLTSFPALPLARANLVAVGDAAGLTRPFSGEGIGPSLSSGIAAGRCLLADASAGGAAAYRRTMLRRYRADFRAWRFGERFLRYPRLVRWLVARAQHPGAQRRVAAVIAGTLPVERVVSPLGLLRLLVGR